MDENQGYVILQSILFDNGRGIALGEHPREGFVTWQFTEEQGRRDYYWGHYHSDLLAAKKDLLERAGAELEYQMTKQERSGEQPEKSGKERERE